MSGWVRTSKRTEELSRDAVEAITAAIGPPGQVATLIVPADVAWQDGAQAAAPPEPAASPAASGEAIEAVADAIRSGRRTGILLGGRALRERGLLAAARIAAATGAKLLAEMFPARLERGAGLPAVERLLYWPELASSQLEGLEQLILVDASSPVTFFAYPGKKSSLVPDGCQVYELAPPTSDVLRSLEELVEALDAAHAKPALQERSMPPRPEGPLNAAAVCQAVGATLPEGAIVSDEAITSGFALPPCTAGGPRHDWLTLTGGAIGQGLPVAVGAAIACPDRPVIALQADGSAPVHDPVAVDDGARAARRHRRAVQQPRLQHPRRRARAGRRARRRRSGQGSAEAGRSGSRFRRARHRARGRRAARRRRGDAHRRPRGGHRRAGPAPDRGCGPRRGSAGGRPRLRPARFE